MGSQRMIKLPKFLWLAVMVLICHAAQAQIGFRAAASGVAPSQVGTTPTLISDRTGTTGSSGATSITVNRPSNVQPGHVLLAQITVKGVVSAITAPSGWTRINLTSSSGTSPVTQAVYWRVAVSGEPGRYQWSGLPGGTRGTGGIAAFSNADTVNPVDNWGVRVNNNTSTITLPNFTTASDNTMLVAALGSSRSSSHTRPTGMNENYDTSSGAGSNGVTSSLATQAQFDYGATGSKTATGPSADNIAHLVALRAGGGALTINVPTGTAVNDVMVASIAMRPCSNNSGAACTTTITAPAGWTLVRLTDTTTGGGTDGYGSRLWVYRRAVTGSEPASYTWSFGGALPQTGAVGGILSFTGVNTSNPIAAESGQVTASGTSHATPGISTGTVANTLLVTSHASNASARWTPPGGMTERVDAASRTAPNNLGISIEVNTQSQAAAGTSGIKTASYSSPAPTANTGGTHILALRPAAAGPDHYELSLPTGSINCLPTAVTVTACANTSSPCTSAYTGASGTTATLSTAGATLGATTVIFNSSGVATTALSYPAAANGTAVSVTLTGEQLAAINPRQCCPNGASCSAANSCSTTFNTAGFIFSGSAGGAVATIPTQVAGTSSSTYYLRAVQTSTTAAACTAALTGATTVNLAYQCNNPTTCSASNRMSVNGGTATTIAANPNSAVSTYTPVPLTFDASGNAPLTLSYSDVGQVTLFASKTVSSAALSGASNAFVVKPGGFVISGIQQTASPQLANPAASSAAGSRFVRTGESFTATVTATTSGGATAPNYGREISPQGVLLTRALVLPGGGNAGTLSNATIPGGSFSSGVATVTNLAWDEVGIITLTPGVGDGSYLGAGDVTGTTTGNIGRFYPDHFAISGVTLTAACTASTPFSYFGQDGFTTAFTLTAQNAANGTTQNYTGAFAKLDLTNYSNYGFSAAPLPAGSSLASSATVPSGTWSNGVASVSAKHQISRPTALTGETTLTVSAAPTDGEVPAGTATAVGSATKLRYGRLQLQNAYGSELLDLPVPLLAQYWNGSAWVQNTDDSCTSIAAPSPGAGLTFYPEVAASVLGNHLSATETTATVSSTGKLAGGDGRLKFFRPGAGNGGYVDITMALASQPWLRYPWTGAGNVDPGARATFGLYKNRLIYIRENY